MAVIPKMLKGSNLIVDGRGAAGRAEEITLPEFNLQVEEHRAAGMDSPVDIDMGMEKMEFGVKMSDHDPEIFKLFGLTSQNAVALTFRGSLENDDESTPYAISVRGMMTKLTLGTVTEGQKAPIDFMISCRYCKITIDGEDVIEIDVPNMKRIIGGVDQLAARRANLGL